MQVKWCLSCGKPITGKRVRCGLSTLIGSCSYKYRKKKELESYHKTKETDAHKRRRLDSKEIVADDWLCYW